jgi:hypothetical protein
MTTAVDVSCLPACGGTPYSLHTCQHHDEELSGVFLAGARIPQPETLAGICASRGMCRSAGWLSSLAGCSPSGRLRRS